MAGEKQASSSQQDVSTDSDGSLFLLLCRPCCVFWYHCQPNLPHYIQYRAKCEFLQAPHSSADPAHATKKVSFFITFLATRIIRNIISNNLYNQFWRMTLSLCVCQVHVVLKLWKTGFSLDNGELRNYNDPGNANFLEAIRRG